MLSSKGYGLFLRHLLVFYKYSHWFGYADECLEMDHCKSNPFDEKAIQCVYSAAVLSSQEKSVINSRA